jgi:hypothetical protein
VTHLVHGSQVLDSLSILTPALQEILREHRLPYLYGCVAADIVQAKKYTRQSLHALPLLAGRLADRRDAEGERQQAFAYGYLSHLAGDVYSHNHFVPIQLVVSYQARTLRHVYWEARFDAAQARDRCRLLRPCSSTAIRTAIGWSSGSSSGRSSRSGRTSASSTRSWRSSGSSSGRR